MAGERVVLMGWTMSPHFARWARGMATAGYDVRVVGLGDRDITDIPTTRFPYHGTTSYLRFRARAVKAAKESNPDLVHAHYASAFGYWLLRCKFAERIVSVWGSDITQFPSNTAKRAFIRRVLLQADRVTATSHYLHDLAVGFHHRIRSKIDIVPFGVEFPDEAPPMPSERPFRICTLKQHKWVYGLDILLRAVAEVRRRRLDIAVSIPGDGEQSLALRQMAVDLGLSDCVQFVGQIEHNAIYDFIGRHHAVVIPSRADAFGVAALEGSACGRPVIATNVEGLPETVRHDQTGLLVEPENDVALAKAIERLADDPDLRARYGEEGRRQVRENYGWQESIRQMDAVYQKVLNG